MPEIFMSEFVLVQMKPKFSFVLWTISFVSIEKFSTHRADSLGT
uniref:Uncharacterized protein n=1 Tax=Romanomermis culicivorax TaxID=13658 RepID=A0A915JA37_ROMCU